MEKEQFYLKQKNNKKSTSWTVSFFNTETRKHEKYEVVRKVRERLSNWNDNSNINKPMARKICNEALKQGVAFTNQSKNINSGITFKEYFYSIWDFKSSSYIQEKLQYGEAIGRQHANNMKAIYKNNIEGILSNDLKLNQVKTVHLQKVIDDMIKKNYSNSSIKKAKNAMAITFKEAKRLNLIGINPILGLNKIPNNNGKTERGILTQEEERKFLKKAKEMFESNSLTAGKYYFLLLACLTGMRRGEIRALTVQDIELKEEYALLNITKSISDLGDLKSTKARKERKVSIPYDLGLKLIKLGNNNPKNTGVIIWTSKPTNSKSIYIGDKYNLLAFNKVLEEIGINSKERKSRNLVFHSLRHSYVTITGEELGTLTAQQLIGHSKARTTLGYTHDTTEKRAKGLQVITNFLDYPLELQEIEEHKETDKKLG